MHSIFNSSISTILLASLFLLHLAASAMAASVPRQDDDFLYDTFPTDFQWGFAVSAYQTEGAWNSDGKGPSAWDSWTHENNGSNIVNGQNGDVACDSYNKFENDTALLKNMGANFYKISLSWPRIVPTGKVADGINPFGIQHYNRVIDNLVANNITPLVTLHQWDVPLPLVENGSWENPEIVQHFSDYARIAFQSFSDRVPLWITLHEPLIMCQQDAIFGKHDAFTEPPTLQYICAHNVLKAHAQSYRIYKDELRLSGQVGLTLNSEWAEPKNQSDYTHVAAAQRLLAFRLGWFLDPLFNGDYPPAMRILISRKSQAEGRNESRLPTFDAEWKQKLIGSVDFIGLNYFFAVNVSPTNGSNGGVDGDAEIATEFDPAWNVTGGGLPITPFGMRKLLSYVTNKYGSSLPIYLINGCGEKEEADSLNDQFRLEFFRTHINECLKAVKLDGFNVKGFTAWSLMDNFEWGSGYSVKYGVHSVDFNNPDLPRTPKASALYLKQVIADNGFPIPKKI